MNLLVTGAWDAREDAIKELEAMGHTVCFLQFERDELPCDYEWVQGVICNGLFLYHDISLFKNLKFIQLTSAGFDRVPMDYVKANNIEIYNARGVYSIPIAEFVLSGVLDLYKKSRFFSENQTAHIWKKNRDLQELFGKTVCIVGAGSVGSECAKRFSAFGTTVLAVDIAKPTDSVYDNYFPLESIGEAIKISDVIVLTLPLTDQTKGMFRESLLSHFKPNAILVNVARGAIVNQNDLIDALQTEKIFGAVLDVFETEPLNADSPLWDMENVIITPHNSFVGEGNSDRLKCVILNHLERSNL